MADFVRTRHLISGQIAEVPVEIFNHAVLGEFLEEVSEDAKPYFDGMYAPREQGDKEVAVYDELDEPVDEPVDEDFDFDLDFDPDKED